MCISPVVSHFPCRLAVVLDVKYRGNESIFTVSVLNLIHDGYVINMSNNLATCQELLCELGAFEGRCHKQTCCHCCEGWG